MDSEIEPASRRNPCRTKRRPNTPISFISPSKSNRDDGEGVNKIQEMKTLEIVTSSDNEAIDTNALTVSQAKEQEQIFKKENKQT